VIPGNEIVPETVLFPVVVPMVTGPDTEVVALSPLAFTDDILK
jgi:hypothetical protein